MEKMWLSYSPQSNCVIIPDQYKETGRRAAAESGAVAVEIIENSE